MKTTAPKSSLSWLVGIFLRLGLVSATLVALVGCTGLAPPVQLDSGAEAVQIYENANLPAGCRELNTIEVNHGEGCGSYGVGLGNEEDAIRLFKNRVLAEGGNAGVIQSSVPPHAIPFCAKNEHKIRGFVFDCPN